ncbi:MAG TPA: c-type cytochrome [Bryobacteraceae bacterium]|nr:c-type cytochrome [Bryobacteraceae bacterium]
MKPNVRAGLLLGGVILLFSIVGGYIVTLPWWNAAGEPDATEWKLPARMPAGQQGELVRYGQKLFNDTPLYLGPDVAGVQMRYAGNRLSCQSCHANGGTQQNGLGLIGITRRFPQFNARAGHAITLEERINGCFERSMNGKALPNDSREMKAYLAYMDWLSADVPSGTKHIDGQGVLKLASLDRWADPGVGEAVFKQNCTVCHGANGLGQKAQDGRSYKYPPLWGPDSFNDGAGMDRVRTAAGYIYANMPKDNPSLTAEEAYDVAAYMDSQDRPHKAQLERDYPNLKAKPFDSPYGPYPDGYSEEQHKYGPFPATSPAP